MKIGDGVTHHVGSDSYPLTVVQIINERKIVAQKDNYKRTDNNGLSESQTYEFTPNPEGAKVTLTLRKNGRWVEQGEEMRSSSYSVGERHAYSDASF